MIDIDKINAGCKKKGKHSKQDVRPTHFASPEAKKIWIAEKRKGVAIKLSKLPKLSRLTGKQS
jgi:hypothetical protein